MARKRFSAEQIVTLLRQIEVSVGQGKTTQVACDSNRGVTQWLDGVNPFKFVTYTELIGKEHPSIFARPVQ